MEDKHVYVVTGANAGIGKALATALACNGCKVIMACRNIEKSEPVRKKIIEASFNSSVELIHLDLSDLESVKKFAHTIASREMTINALLNNAGAMAPRFTPTAQGFENDMGSNFLGHFALTMALLANMNHDSRIINTLSCTIKGVKIEPGFMTADMASWQRMRSYAKSKLALAYMCNFLNDKLTNRNINIYGYDPGVVNTGIISMGKWFDPLADLLFRPLISSPQKGADTALWLATEQIHPQDTVFFRKRMKWNLNLDKELGVKLMTEATTILSEHGIKCEL